MVRRAAVGWVVGLLGALGAGAALLLAFAASRTGEFHSTWDRLTWLGMPEIPFTVSDGYDAVRVAAPPLIKQPMFACFDDRGRLYVAGSSGHNLNADELSKDPPDVIRRLEDTDGDGTFDRSVIFADKLTYPQGVLWHDGAIYTASPPSLWRLEDTDGDGVADRRQELLTGFPFTGIADDLHGPSLGPDGRIYWGVGRFPYEIRPPGGPVFRKGRAPLVLRSRPDGSELEVVSAGLGNPVEVTFSPLGEPFACGTFFAPPDMGADLRDAIIHCVAGGVFPVRDYTSNEDPRTGDLLGPVLHLGVAAPSGLTRARGGDSGDDRQELFCALFNMHSVRRVALERTGATFRADSADLLSSEYADFHPTDVLEDADGSLLVVDTGGWYRRCPTSQVDKPDVLGGIYRLRRRGAPRVADPWGTRLDWTGCTPADLARRLDDARFAVRDRAVAALAARGAAAVPVLKKSLDPASTPARARRGVLWALARIEGAEARAAARTALGDPDPGVRVVAANVVGLHRDAGGLDGLKKLLAGDDPAGRREAATALGRIGRPEAVPPLLGALRAGGDRFLEHALIFALIAIDDGKATGRGLKDPNPAVRRAALIALDQMKHGGLTPGQVTPLLDPAEPDLQEAALRVLASRPDWAHEMVGVFRDWLARRRLPGPQREMLRNALAAYARAPEIQELIASAVRSDETPVPARVMLLEVMAEAELMWPPEPWLEALRAALGSAQPRVVRQAAVTIRTLGISDFDDELTRLARDPARAPDLRLDAFEAVAYRLDPVDETLFTFLLMQLAHDEDPLRRLAAARCLGAARMNTDQLVTLAESVARAGALVLPRLLPAYARSSDPRVGRRLLGALARAPGLRSLSPEGIRAVVATYPHDVQAEIAPLLKRFDLGVEQKAARLAELDPVLRQGNPVHGRDVFFGPKATCSTCHTVRGEGGHVGPDLSRIGSVRTGRDLLEAIVFPSASFARGYEPYLVATADGRTYTGVVASEDASALSLMTPGRGLLRLRRSVIEAVEPGRESVMPRGLEANITRGELSDVIAFLRSLK